MPEPSYKFGPFQLLPSQRRLLEAGVPVLLGSRAFDLLVALVQGRGRVVTKAELIQRVWASHVEESSLTVAASALRRALRDGTGGGHYIETVSGRGYRFVGPVEVSGSSLPAPDLDAP